MSLALGLALSHTVHAQSLVDLFGAAKQYDATYRGAQAQYEANKAKADQVISAIFPTINLQTNATRTHANANSTSSTFTFDRYYSTPNMVLSLNQPLYRPANLLQYEQSKLQLAQAVQTLVTAEQDLIVRVSQAYFDVLVSQDSLSFVLAQKAAVAEQLAAAKRNFEVGTATITDTREAEARFDLVKAQEIAARNDLSVKQLALETVTGVVGAKPVPSIKLATNTPMYTRLTEDMDYNCGVLLDGTSTMPEVAQGIFDLICRVASGERTKSELLGLGDHEFVPWNIGVTS